LAEGVKSHFSGCHFFLPAWSIFSLRPPTNSGVALHDPQPRFLSPRFFFSEYLWVVLVLATTLFFFRCVSTVFHLDSCLAWFPHYFVAAPFAKPRGAHLLGPVQSLRFKTLACFAHLLLSFCDLVDFREFLHHGPGVDAFRFSAFFQALFGSCWRSSSPAVLPLWWSGTF